MMNVRMTRRRNSAMQASIPSILNAAASTVSGTVGSWFQANVAAPAAAATAAAAPYVAEAAEAAAPYIEQGHAMAADAAAAAMAAVTAEGVPQAAAMAGAAAVGAAMGVAMTSGGNRMEEDSDDDSERDPSFDPNAAASTEAEDNDDDDEYVNSGDESVTVTATATVTRVIYKKRTCKRSTKGGLLVTVTGTAPNLKVSTIHCSKLAKGKAVAGCIHHIGNKNGRGACLTPRREEAVIKKHLASAASGRYANGKCCKHMDRWKTFANQYGGVAGKLRSSSTAAAAEADEAVEQPEE